MSRLQSSDFAPSIACLEDAWSELSQPSAADKDAPSILPNISSPQVSIPLADEGASSISLHQNPNCSTSTYRYYGETEDDVPHGVGIRIYTNSGSIEKGQFFHGVFQSLGEFTCADYGETPPLLPPCCSPPPAVHRGSFLGGVAHGLGVRQWVHFPPSKDLPGIILSRRYQMNGATPFEAEQIGEFRYGTFLTPASILNQFHLEIELAIRSGIAAADPTNAAKQTAKSLALERESEDRRSFEAECERQRLEQEALALQAQQSAPESKSSSCIIF